MSNTWGQMIRDQRLLLGYSLRAFCSEHDLDPAYVSRLERGVAPVPEHETVLEWADRLGFADGSPQRENFLNAADADAKRIPNEVVSDEELLASMPALLRTVHDKRLTREQFDNLIELLRNSK